MRVPRCRAIAVAVVAGAVTSCSGSHAAGVAPVPPRAEFILSNADSSFWVATTSGDIRVRGAPLMLARYGKRFYELYTADDDRSYPDALFVGVRLYRRDILTGDSAIVFSDTAVSRVADIYARTHPDERPLAPDEEGDADPATSATAEVDILDVFGPFVSYEYHVDVELPRRAPWHTTLRGVLDLRTGKQTAVSDLIGQARAQALLASARRSYELVRDSLRAITPLTAAERKAVDELERRHFDPRCFAIENVDGRPSITFGVPGAGEGNAGNLVELEPIPVDSLDWWADVRPLLATVDSSDNDRWTGTKYSLLARYDAAGQSARLSLLDSTKREWSLGSAGAPLKRVDWLDRPPPTDAERVALRRAFDQAANYDDNARVAEAPARGVGVMRFASVRRFRHAPLRQSSERRGTSIRPTRSVIR